MFSKKTKRALLPLLVVIPYITYVINNRFEAHKVRREELDYARAKAREEEANK